MAYGQIDPERPEGEALTRWYLRSPADIEQERQANAAQKYADFFRDRPGSFVTQDGMTRDPSRPDLGDVRFGQVRAMRHELAPFSEFGVPPAGNGVSRGRERAPDAIDLTTNASATSETSHSDGNVQVASGPSKDQCIKQCTPLLERPQPPWSDRNRWDFHKCVNAFMDPSRRSGPNSAPSVPVRPVPAPHPTPWWMWIPRLLPEAAAALA
jgi:hypothetical protein